MKMSQSTRILILLALIVAAVAVWYTLFTGPQTAPPPATATVSRTAPQKRDAPPPAVTTSARALQVLPIPFLVTEAPEEAPLATEAPARQVALASAQVPPNPFVPLRPPKTAEAPKPIAEAPEKPVTITPEAELPNNIPLPKVVTPTGGEVTPPPVSLGQGTLPIKLTPLTAEVAPETPLEATVPEEAPAAEEVTPEQQTPPVEEAPPPNPLVEWAKQRGLKLDGVALGPVSVAIFKTTTGYLALPVGQTFPGDNVLVKTITAERVLLVDADGANTLTLELGGGE
ncbi:hypothetical protein [Oceanithermus sp.]|uniref:hypothetical protein n=1 Tax=Oceanithermus sp. TaxID=2268145 RepID=UPI0025E22444|nr:hypothetical protein [Oceanithermus sp.]